MASINKCILVVKGLKLTIFMSESGYVVWMPEFDHLHVLVQLYIIICQ